MHVFTGLAKGNYKMLGTMFSVCIVHGGVGPRVLSRRLFSQLAGIPTLELDLTEVNDSELRDQLDKVSLKSGSLGIYLFFC